VVKGTARAREHLVGFYGEPGTPLFKLMVRTPDWKYIFLANGGREQLFHLGDDPAEVVNRIGEADAVAAELRVLAAAACRCPGAQDALDTGGELRVFPFTERPRGRIYQFDRSRGVTGFPETPEAGLARWRETTGH
jgi:choline-sulfatase